MIPTKTVVWCPRKREAVDFNVFRLGSIEHNLKLLILTVLGYAKFRLTERR